MSTDRDVTRIVRSWLHEDAYEDADRILNLVLDEVDTTPQRRAGWLARRLRPMNSTMRIALAVAAVVAIAVVGISLLIPRNIGNPTESANPTAIPNGLYETVVSETEQASDDLGPCPCTWAFTLDGDQFGLTGPGEQPTRVEFSGDQMTLPDWNQGQADPSITVRWAFDAETQAVTFSEMVGGTTGDRFVFERTWVKVAIATPPRLNGQEPLPAGTYLVDPLLPMDVRVEVPDDWSASGNWVVIGPKGNQAPDGMAIRFYTAPSLYLHPLAPDDGLLPAAGPSAEDLVTAMVEHPDWPTTGPTAITVDGYAGQVVHLTLPEGTTDSTPFYLFGDESGGQIWGWAAGQVHDLYVVDVDGERLIIDAFHYPGTSEEDLAAQTMVIDSIQLAP
jgi:hypothetical protein